MSSKDKRRWAYGFVVLMVSYLAAFYVMPSFLASSDGNAASGQCVPYHAVRLDHRENHGQAWRITASIEKNGTCSFGLVTMKFSPQETSRGSWTMGWSIPAHGHLPLTATIDAGDYGEVNGRAVGGGVGIRVRTVVLKLSGGDTIVVHPKKPSRRLLTSFVWLRNLRYFLRFYPAGEHVKTARLLDAKGKVITTVRSEEGEIEGFMGL